MSKIIIKRRIEAGQPEAARQDTNAPAFRAEQLSGKDPRGNFILSVIVKRSYVLSPNGQLFPAAETPLLTDDLKYYDDQPEILESDADLYPYKPYTDVVIKGKARALRAMREFSAEIRVGNHQTSLLVLGHRRPYRTPSGQFRFSEPEPVEEVPLRYDFAYGGVDTIAEEKIKLPPPEYTKHVPPEIDIMRASHCRYPRNPAGKGYLLEPDQRMIDQLELPNLEDPEDRLWPDRLVVGAPERWLYMPIPRATDWLSPVWFPRIAYFGVSAVPDDVPKRLPEIERRWADPNIVVNRPLGENFNFRCINGASLGLQLPYLQGNESCLLTNIHPAASHFTFRLPGEKPGIWIDGRNGKLIETVPVLHTVIIHTEEGRVDLVWRGSGPAIRPYLPEELAVMPFKVTWNRA